MPTFVQVRHFFCTSDQDYVRSLSEQMPPDTLSALPSGPARLVIIGCGDPSRILPYAAETSCAFPVFTDPSRRLFANLGMKRTMAVSPNPPYVRHSTLGLVLKSVMQMIWSGWGALKGGDYIQNGGEWIFKEGKCVWAHRMKTMSDHMPAEELLQVLAHVEGLAN